MVRLSRRSAIRASGAGLGVAVLSPLLPCAARAYRVEDRINTPASLSGVVRYAGRVGPPPRVTFSGDCAYCRRFDLRVESLVVGPGRGLRNVAVMLEGIDHGRPPGRETPVLAERQCTFVPHVLTLTIGSSVLLHNQDPVLNTFHAVALPSGRTLFNIGMPRKDQKLQRRIREKGLIQMRCDVHPWEEAYVVAVEHPYHAVSDRAGAFVLEQIPPGDYTLALWHEQLGTRRQPVRLGPGAHLKVEVTYPAAAGART